MYLSTRAACIPRPFQQASGAKKFKRWVTSEVLPSIRKHGAYMTSDTIDKMINSPEFGIKLLTALRDEQDKRKALETELDRSKEWYSIKRVAHLNGVSYKVFDWRKLKLESQRQGYGVKKIFDANYGEVNTYHVNVWEKVYPQYGTIRIVDRKVVLWLHG